MAQPAETEEVCNRDFILGGGGGGGQSGAKRRACRVLLEELECGIEDGSTRVLSERYGVSPEHPFLTHGVRESPGCTGGLGFYPSTGSGAEPPYSESCVSAASPEIVLQIKQ